MRPVLFLLLLIAAASNSALGGPLKVFILCGQSNMQGHARISTLQHLGMNPETTPLLKQIQSEEGVSRVFNDVRIAWFSASGERSGPLTTGYGADESKVGPELMFGIRMADQLNEPILIIKTAWGGKSLNTDFRPPSAGVYQFNDQQLENMKRRDTDIEEARHKREEASGHYYRLTLSHVQTVLQNISDYHPAYKADEGYELAGFVWFQGWNDMVDSGTYPQRGQPGGYASYSDNLALFIRDLRRDLKSPQLPFVIGVMGVNGPTALYGPEQQRYKAIHQGFRDAMAAPAALPEFRDSVKAVLTEQSWDQQLTALRKKQGDVRQKVRQRQKAESLDRNATRELEEELMADALTVQERELLGVAVSNAEFHYLGSGKIMVDIGRRFADAMYELISPAAKR